MSVQAVAIQGTGLVTSVGLTVAGSCAAFRAKLTNPTETRFINSLGEWIIAHEVPLDQPWRGFTKLVKMAAMAIAEAMQDIPREQWRQVPLLLCVAELERPGRLSDLDERLFERIQQELGVNFAPSSAIVARGRISVAVAMAQARTLMSQSNVQCVLVAATDSFLSWPTLSHFERQGRLLTARNPDGFMPGEAPGALKLVRPSGQVGELQCTGIGFGHEAAHIGSEQPLRAEGLTQAINAALLDANRQMHEMDFRITDSSGEQYYFKEAAVALSRILRVRKKEFDIWHPAECTGEVGAATGFTIISAAQAACDRQYSQGPNILVHMSNDAGQRAALSLQYLSPA